jgi:hypothetical protein
MDSKQSRERLPLTQPEGSNVAHASVDEFGNYNGALITQDSDLLIQQASDNYNVSLKLSKKDAIAMIMSILCLYSNEPELEDFQESINNLNKAIKSKFT